VRRPLLRFALLGALLFAVDRAQPAPTLAHDPTLDDDGLLVAEALAHDLHRHDDVVRRRLVQNLRFVRPDDPRSDAALLDEAIALGLHETDLVVQRRLAQRMRLQLAAAVHANEPTEAELRAYLEAHAERFTEPARIRLTQLYFADAGRAEAARAALPAPEATAPLPGDPLPLPRALPPHSEAELAARFGPAFATAAFAAPEGRWVGPLGSAYGHHLVFVHARAPARLSRFETVRSELREALLAERGAAAVARALAALRGGP
jgi:hypothetical protein